MSKQGARDADHRDPAGGGGAVPIHKLIWHKNEGKNSKFECPGHNNNIHRATSHYVLYYHYYYQHQDFPIF